MRSIEEIEAYLEPALASDARGRLVDRGEARAMIRRSGELPGDAQAVAQSLDADLADYGFSVLDAALELRALDKRHALLKTSFELAGRVFEALVKHGDPRLPERGFYRIIAASSFHLAGYAAMAYALLSEVTREGLNLNPGEEVLVLLILRDLAQLRSMSRDWLTDPKNGDQSVLEGLDNDENERDHVLGIAVLTGMFRGIAYLEFALQTGDTSLIERSRNIFDAAYGLASSASLVTLWWIVRLVRDLIDDLWSHSLHEVIPRAPSDGPSNAYSENRRIFIARLFDRSVSQVELWPSQIVAARRAADTSDDLVVALPTSAGKTRIAELATLTCLSAGKRVLVMTPLRALSAQTERSFRETFSALGVTVSSLYGKSGLSAGDAYALATDHIIVATPEKLDFALRSDPDVINDIGLIVLDEGHMIGAEEREIRFEILVQRLLRRDDSGRRRIVCLSAILPEGQELADMTAWIRADDPGEPVRSEWRPTRQRFGILEWRNGKGALRYNLEEDGPYVSRFLTEMQAIAPERRPRPRDKKDITLMTAWRFAEEQKRTLIFVTQANWVEGFAERALELTRRGYLPSLLEDETAIEDAQTIGREWLGADHPAVACLSIGVAVHHGKLPSPFLREVERLLASGVIRVTAASPTLAQGLNLNAAVLLAPYLVRAGEPITGEEFANVAGRAGRAFVDTEGLILHVMEDRFDHRKAQWRNLIQQAHARSLKSGLVLLINQVVRRLNKREIPRNADGYEFLANARQDWLIEPEGDIDGPPLEDLIARLDGIIFGLIEALDADADTLPELLDQALAGSLWVRQLNQKEPQYKSMQRIVLHTRARLIWNESTAIQRKGHFAMGVGLDTGLTIDGLADALAAELDRADLAALQGDLDNLHGSLVLLARALLTVKPFAPTNGLPHGWEQVLRQWLLGAPISEIADDSVPIIEDIFVYRLVWAIEAVRTRRVAHGWTGGDLAAEGMAAACLDTGLPEYRMSMLVRVGLPSREAAKLAIQAFETILLDADDLRRWLLSDEIVAASAQTNWPSSETASLWNRFRNDFLSARDPAWTTELVVLNGVTRPAQTDDLCRIEFSEDGKLQIYAPDYRSLGGAEAGVGPYGMGSIFGRWTNDNTLEIIRTGPRS